MLCNALLLATLAAAPSPLTLDDALALAARANPDLRLARLQRESAAVEARASYSAILPRLDLGSSFGRSVYGPQQRVTTAPQLGTDPTTGAPVLTFQQQAVEIPGEGVSNYSLGVQLQQPFFDGFRGAGLIARGKEGVVVAGRQHDETALSVALAVTRLFYEVTKADRAVWVLEDTVARSEQLVKRSDALFEAGRVSKSDAIAARVNLGSDRISLESQRARAAQARTELATALGLPAGEVGEVRPPPDVDSDEPASREPPELEVLVERARAARPAFARARALVEQARQDKRIADSEWWPTVTGLLAYDRAGPTLAGSEGVWGDPTRQYVATAQVSVAMNLFNGGQSSANAQRASIAERTALVQAEQLAVQVEGELARARSSVLALGRAVALASENVKQAEEGVRLAQGRLEAGAATQLEVRDASLKYTQARLTLVNARIDLIVARADLNRAAGGGQDQEDS